jgi:hypothetical protein
MKLSRNEFGAIVVVDTEEYQRYKRDVSHKSEILSLREEVSNLQAYVLELIKLNQKTLEKHSE